MSGALGAGLWTVFESKINADLIGAVDLTVSHPFESL
jgi:hypothetical protein